MGLRGALPFRFSNQSFIRMSLSSHPP
jgi:hypothetical protein